MASIEQVYDAYENAKLAGDIEAADRLQVVSAVTVTVFYIGKWV